MTTFKIGIDAASRRSFREKYLRRLVVLIDERQSEYPLSNFYEIDARQHPRGYDEEVSSISCADKLLSSLSSDILAVYLVLK